MTGLSLSERWQRWCGICFQWREERDGRCVACGNAHMRGDRLPLQAVGAAGADDTPRGRTGG